MKTIKLFALALSVALLANGAFAADLPSRAAPPVFAPSPSPTYSWTGCYVGVEGGGNFGHSQQYHNDATAAPALNGLPETGGISLTGGLVGGTVGCNYQYNTFVVGLENDFSWTDSQGIAGLTPPFNTTETAQTKEHWIGTFRGRIGVAWDRWFFYGTGGGAIANEAFTVCDPINGCGGGSTSTVGWAAGAGVEYAIWQNVSVKLEYLHTDFGSTGFAQVSNPGGGFFAARTVTLNDNIVRAGVNYKFDLFAAAPAPVVARY